MRKLWRRVATVISLLVTLGGGSSWGGPPEQAGPGRGNKKASRALHVTDLGTLGGSESFASAINDRGQIVGISRTAGDQDTHMFLYDGDSLIDLSATYNIGSGAYASSANAINRAGEIAGTMPSGDAMLLRQGVVTDLGRAGASYSIALGINNAGQAVGYYASPEFALHAFVYDGDRLTDLGPAGPEALSVATAINRSGTITGHATSTFRIPSHAFIYSGDVMRDITPFGSVESYGEGINDRGDVVGEYLTSDGTAFHAFLYSDGAFTDIAASNSPETVAYGINNHGQVVGTTWAPYTGVCLNDRTGESYPCTKYKPHAFVYEKGRLTDLNSLIQPGSGWELAWAFAINNKGQVVGWGLVNGKFRAFVVSL
jgi:probable HAF family extracellular repeat protein